MKNNQSFDVSFFDWLSPVVATQQSLNYLASSDINNYLDYQNAVQSFHSELCSFIIYLFYKKS